MGGDPGRDLYTSPGDPLFYLHHVGQAIAVKRSYADLPSV